ncbi:MAG: sialidase, partial [Acidobacteria bacterium]|nr:sialidase [Acidobacteriota bacterium]
MRTVPLPRLAAGSALSLGVAILLSAAAFAAEGRFDALRWRHIGPVGNRVSAVYGIPGDPNTYYFGAASGGVFKTTDGGIHWTPVFDDQPVLSVGAIAVSTADPNVVWVGTGEAHIRSNVSLGNGVYRSTDAGESWTHTGLEATGRISRIVTHRADPDT